MRAGNSESLEGSVSHAGVRAYVQVQDRARGPSWGLTLVTRTNNPTVPKVPLFELVKIIYGCATLFGSNSKLRLPGFGFK